MRLISMVSSLALVLIAGNANAQAQLVDTLCGDFFSDPIDVQVTMRGKDGGLAWACKGSTFWPWTALPTAMWKSDLQDAYF